MKRLVLMVWLAVILPMLCFAAASHAQSANIAAREAEWQAYKLPSTEFARFIDSSKSLVLRVPVEWKQQGSALNFKSDDGVQLSVFIEKIPDGIPLQSYVTALLQGFRTLPGGADSVVSRRSYIQETLTRWFSALILLAAKLALS